jgi:hypothetical protein
VMKVGTLNIGDVAPCFEHLPSMCKVWSPTLKTRKKKGKENGFPYLLPDSRGKAFHFSHLICPCNVWTLLYCGTFLIYPIHWEFFFSSSWGDVKFYQVFLYSIEMIILLLCLILLMWCSTFIDLHMSNIPASRGLIPLDLSECPF